MSITLEIIEGPYPATSEDGWQHNAYTVKLGRGARRLTVPWMQGTGIEGPPSAEDVLENLLLDACGYENAVDFEGWAAEYGYDTDSRTAERTWRAVATQTRKLKRFLGADYDACATEDAHESAHWLVSA